MKLLRETIRALLLENDSNKDGVFSPIRFEKDKKAAFDQMESLLKEELGVEFAISQNFIDTIPLFPDIDSKLKDRAIRKAKTLYLKKQKLSNPLVAKTEIFIVAEKKRDRHTNSILAALDISEKLSIAPFDNTSDLLMYLLLKNIGYKKHALFLLKSPGYNKKQHDLIRNQKRDWIDTFQPYKQDWNFLHHVGAYSTGWKQEFLSLKGILDFINSLNSKDELSTVAVPKSANDVLAWDSLFEDKLFAVKLEGFCTGMWDEDSFTTTFGTGMFGGQKANSGFNKYGFDQGTLSQLVANDEHFLSQQELENIHTGKLSKAKHGYYEATLDNHKVVGVYFNDSFLSYFHWLASEREQEDFRLYAQQLIKALHMLEAQSLQLYGMDNKLLDISSIQQQLAEIYEMEWDETL